MMEFFEPQPRQSTASIKNNTTGKVTAVGFDISAKRKQRIEAKYHRRRASPRKRVDTTAARRSRNQYVPTTDEHGWTRIRESLSSSVLIRVHPWLKKSSRAATISGDTDRLQVCATDAASKLNTCRGEGRAFAAPKRLRPRRRGEGE